MRIDTRAGSSDLIAPLRLRGVTVEEAMLPSGDVEIVGRGPEERPVLVGIEVKKIPDLLQCIRNGRFADQLRAMRQSYEVRWLLVEGRWQGFGHREDMAVRRGERWHTVPSHISYQEVASWTLTMANRAGLLIWRTESEEETVAWLRAHELWWTAKEYRDHRAVMDFYIPPIEAGDAFAEPTLVRKVANVLPGLAGVLSERADAEFSSVREMINADEERWRRIHGIAKVKARRLVEALNG